MTIAIHDAFTAVMKAASKDELLHESLSFARWLGFETITVMVAADRVGKEPVFAWVDNTPEAYRQSANNVENARRDPISQHCKRSSLPIAWNQDTYTSHGLGEKWEMQACHGYCTGIAFALHLPKGMHVVVGFDRDQPLPANSAEVSRMVAELQLFAVHAQDAALRVLLAEQVQEPSGPSLTPRELECLRWTMDGKTAWEVGRILGIGEQTAVRHLNNATHKLDCVNKHHAMVKALRLGLIR